MLLEAVDRSESSRRELAILDARAALAEKDSFAQYMAQFKRPKRNG